MKTLIRKNTILSRCCLLVIIMLLVTCSSDKNEKLIAPEGMHTIELTKYGKPFAIFVPDTNKSRLEIRELTSGALQIMVGDHFGIAIRESESDLHLLKEDLKSDEINKLRNFITEDKNTLVWESGISSSEFHFTTNQVINNRSYNFEDLRNTESRSFTKTEIERMLKSATDAVSIKNHR